MKIISVLCLITFNLMAISANAGGGWTKEKGKLFMKISEWWTISDQHYTNTGGIDPNATRSTFNSSIYAEYGLTDRFTGIVYFPFLSRTTLYEQRSATTRELISEGDAINSIGDTDLTLKYGLIQGKPIVVSASLILGLPLGNNSGGRDGSLQTGDGEFNQMLQIDASTSIKAGNYYPWFSLFTAFNNRTNGYSDEFRFGVETGISVKKWIGILRMTGVQSFKNGDNAFNAIGTSIFANNTEYLTFSPELGYNFSEKVGMSVNYAIALSGRVIFADPAYSVGVYFNL